MLRDITLGQYYPADSVIHKLDPRVKLFATLIYIISLFCFKGIAALLAAVDKRVRFDAAQSLTALEQEQARQNIGAVSVLDIGNADTDFVAAFEAALLA